MINILVSESGGPAAIGLIKSIMLTDYNVVIIGIDSSELSAGGELCDYSYITPLSSDPNYFNIVLDIINKHNINLILPTGEHDVSIFAEKKEELKELGCKVYCSELSTIELCQNKSTFFKILKNTSVPIPQTFTSDMIIKPKRGCGSRGIKRIELEEEIIQEYLPGAEYTVDVFCDDNGNLLTHVIRERLDIKAGISAKGRIVKRDYISRIILELCVRLNLKGPSCIQFRESKNGLPCVIECNPRLGGGTFMSTLAGVNYAELYFDLFTNKKPIIKEAKEITVLRYYNEIIV